MRGRLERHVVARDCLRGDRRLPGDPPRSVRRGSAASSTTFPVNFNDVDYCLKVARRAAAGSSTTPTSSLFHFESSTREAVVEEWEVLQLVRRWRQVAAVDPYGNPNLRLGPAPRLRLPQLGASAAAAGCGSCGWLSEQVPPDGESGQRPRVARRSPSVDQAVAGD